MTNRKTLSLAFIAVSVISIDCFAGRVRFGSQDSAFKVHDYARLHATKRLTNSGGTISHEVNAHLTGIDILFDTGYLQDGSTEALLTGTFNLPATLSGNKVVQLRGSLNEPAHFDAEPGMALHRIFVSGTNNLLTGQPLLAIPIVLQDASTMLSIGIQNSLDQDITLNGGTLYLHDDLDLDARVLLNGLGTVVFNEKTLSLDPQEQALSNMLYFDSASMEMNSGVALSGKWTFSGTSYLNANEYAIDLSLGGTLAIEKGSRLYVSAGKIKGFGTHAGGRILFEDENAELHMIGAELELTATYTVTTGKIYAEIHDLNVVTRDRVLYFENDGKLILDGVNVFYEPRETGAYDAIQPAYGIRVAKNENTTLPASTYVATNPGFNVYKIRGGEIYQYRTYLSGETGGAAGFVANEFLINTGQKIISPGTFDNSGKFIHFARDVANQLILQNGTHHLTNVVFKDFAPSVIDFMSNDVRFGEGTTIEWAPKQQEELSTELILEKDCILDGKGQVINLATGGSIKLTGADANVLIKDVTLKGVSGTNKLYCDNDGGTIKLQDVTLVLSDTYQFNTGSFEIIDNVKVVNGTNNDHVAFVLGINGNFAGPSTITANSTFFFDRRTGFSYAPVSGGANLLAMQNETSVLYLNGARLHSNTFGMRLLNGTLVIDHNCTVYSDATVLNDAIRFGNGTPANNLNIEIMPGGSIDIVEGWLNYQNDD